jgi:hypothetical protein
MLFAVSALKGLAVAASDGGIGVVKDFLFDDRNWRLRWMVVDTGGWLPGRKVLIQPSAIAPLDLGPTWANRLPQTNFAPELWLSLRLTCGQVATSPELAEHEPVSLQMQRRLHEHYGWDPEWGASYFGANGIQTALLTPPHSLAAAERDDAYTPAPPDRGDPHLRSVAAVVGYGIHASDGDIGHVENLLADDAHWDIRYLVAATRNWWPGKHVLLAPYAVRDVDWYDHHVHLKVSREQVQMSPPWDPLALTDQLAERTLHAHYGWPGYGW